MYIVFTSLALMMVVMTGVIPHTVPTVWRINDAILMCPLAFLVGGHLLAPLVGDPLANYQPPLLSSQVYFVV